VKGGEQRNRGAVKGKPPIKGGRAAGLQQEAFHQKYIECSWIGGMSERGVVKEVRQCRSRAWKAEGNRIWGATLGASRGFD